MKLTILGTSAAYPGLNNPCSGYLVQDGNRNIIIDCGSGVLGNLQRYLNLGSISDIIITHMHADHFFDLVPYRYALKYGLIGRKASRPRLHLPPGGTEILDKVVSPFAECNKFFSDVFEISEYNTGRRLQLGHFVVRFVAVRHYVPTYALSITSSRKLAYTSDSGMCPELLKVAKNADLFLCSVGRCLGAEITHLWGHLLPEEAGTLAKEANVKRLIITHLWPSCDQTLSLRQASDAFGGRTEVAEIHHTYIL